MMALNPQHRFQTASQLVEAIRSVRREMEGKNNPKAANTTTSSTTRSVFVAESDERLQDKIRKGFKELGYRVFMAADPVRALDRFRQQPYDAIVLDAGTTGEDGLLIFERIMKEVDRLEITCVGILVLNQEQADWANRIQVRPHVSVMVRPVTLKQLEHKLEEMVPMASAES
jgi:DNA-binding response OmpR family regulator